MERLCELEWAHPSDTHTLVQDPELGRPRAQLFLTLLEEGLRSNDWSHFDAASGSVAVERLLRRVLTVDELNRRALAITGVILPLAAGEPEPVGVLLALFDTMQALGTRVIAAYNQRLEEEARQLDDVKTLFLRIAGHDLRTPLSVISGYSTMASSGALGTVPDQLAPAVEAITRSALRALNILDRVVEAARLESRSEAVRRERCALREILDAAVEPYRETARERSVRLAVEADETHALLDREEMVTAIGNLIANALKYGDAGGAVVASARREGDEMVFTVSDRGRGIETDELKHLFERFYRTPLTAASGIPGSGLGLYIVKRIAELHGGQVFVESTPGVGSLFGMRLPVLDRRPAAPPASTDRAVPATA